MVVHGDKLRWLLWLRWRLVLRGFTRGTARVGNIIGSIILLIFWLLFGGGLAVGTYFAYHYAQAPYNSEVLFLVLTGIYIVWIIAPLMQVATNEGLDVSKLSQFPLTRAELMISLLLSTLLDISTLALLFLFAAVVAGWAFSVPLALMALLTVLIFYVQTIGMSQLVIALLSRMLQSRRMRDLSVIIVVLFSASAYLSQFAFRNAGFLNALQQGLFSTYLQWLPSGMAARAIQQAYVGNWGLSFVWLAALLVLSVLVLYLWQMLVERSLAAPEIGGVQRTRRRRVEQGTAVNAAQVAQVSRGGWSFIPPQVLAIASKEIKYFRRDPQFARLILLPLVYVVVLVFSTIYNANNAPTEVGTGGIFDILNGLRTMFAPSIVLLSLFSLSYNTLGFERESLTTLFLFPINPRYILWGKNLVIFVLGLVELLALVLLVSFFTHTWTFALPALTLGLAGIGVILACGNVTSVFLPQRMRLTQRGFQTSSTNMSAQAGCLRVVMSFAAMIADLLALTPVAAALILPIIFHAQWFWLISVPLSLAYGALIYFGVTALVAPRMVARAPEILALVTKE